MEKIIEEKRRQRTTSERSLDGCVITRNNEIIKDKNLIKKLMLERLEEEAQNKFMKKVPNGTTKGPLTLPPDPQEESDFAERKISAPSLPFNKHLERVRLGGGGGVGSTPLISSTGSLGRRKRTTSNASELWKRGDFGSRSNLEQAIFKKEIARPMYRQDIFYTGSVTSLAAFQSNRSLKSYVDSNTSIPEPEPEEVGHLPLNFIGTHWKTHTKQRLRLLEPTPVTCAIPMVLTTTTTISSERK